VLAVLYVPSASASEADEAEAGLVIATGLFARNEYEQALDQIRRARKTPNTGRMELDASLALWEGLLLLHLGRKDEFKTHLEVAFLLQPELALPARLSPKIKQRVEEIRGQVKKELALRPARAAEPKPEPAVEAKPALTPERPPAPKPVVQVAPAQAPAPESSLPSAELARSGPSPAIPLVLGGVALGAGAAGAWFGLQSQDAVARARAEREQISAATTLVAAQDQALAANVAFAVAGTAALAALVTLLVSQ
jgi:hypothetical protein